MNKKTLESMPLGLYRVYWRTGGISLAAMGQNANGLRWIAPANWLAPPDAEKCQAYFRHHISKMELIAKAD
jgi:hypothetical protein